MVLAIMAVGGLPAPRSAGASPFSAASRSRHLRHLIPSCLVYYHLLPTSLLQPVTAFFRNTNFLYLFITPSSGSILAWIAAAVKGFLKIFVPLASGSIVAATVGTLVGTALGMGARHTFFFTVVPIMAGGVGEGAIPLLYRLRANPASEPGRDVRASVAAGDARSLMAILLLDC